MKFNLIALDETEFFNDEELKEKIGRYFTVYMYNPEEPTHCCELTPSFYLQPVDWFTENELDEKTYDMLAEGHCNTEPCYVHCRRVEMKSDTIDGMRVKYEGVRDFEDEEEALEYYQGNPKLG